jgi:hypothetical protein
MNGDDLFRRLRAKGEEVVAEALAGAMRGKEKLDEAAAKALKSMNVPTRTEFKKALRRIESLEAELASLKAQAAPKPAGKSRAKRATPARRAE